MTQNLPMRASRRPGWGQTVRFILLLASVVLVLIPVYVLLVTSFKGSADADPSRTWFLPEVWVTKNWSNAWNQLSGGLLRSLALVSPPRSSRRCWEVPMASCCPSGGSRGHVVFTLDPVRHVHPLPGRHDPAHEAR